MIEVTRINHVPLVLNSDLIEHVEATPDTVITLTTGHKLIVLESADDQESYQRSPGDSITSNATTDHQWRKKNKQGLPKRPTGRAARSART